MRIIYFIRVIACIFFLKNYNKIEIGYWRCRFMSKKYYKYLPWLIIGAFSSDGVATHYAQTTFDLFYLTTIFMIVYVSLMYLHEHYLKYKYRDLFIRIMSNSKKDKHPQQSDSIKKEVGILSRPHFFMTNKSLTRWLN